MILLFFHFLIFLQDDLSLILSTYDQKTNAIIMTFLLLTSFSCAQSESDLQKDLDLMGFNVTDISISKGASSISYEYPNDQTSGETINDWIKIAIAVIAYTPPEPQIITVVPEIGGVPVYEVKIDSKSVILYLDGQISLESLVDDMEYVELEEQQASIKEGVTERSSDKEFSLWLWLVGGGAVLFIVGIGGLVLLFVFWIFIKRRKRKEKKDNDAQYEDAKLQTQYKYCTQCGVEIPVDSQFCTECGAEN